MNRTMAGVGAWARLCVIAVGVLTSRAGYAFTFEETAFGVHVNGAFDSTITAGTGIRVQSPSCGLVLTNPSGAGAPAGCLALTSGLGDQGDLNYAKGDPFTAYLKGTHDLLLNFPDDWKFLGRFSWLRDFRATDTTDYVSAGNPAGVGSQTPQAKSDLRWLARILDLWVSKQFAIGDQQARVRVGNQVISWGESIFLPGGINSTNALDLMRLAQPGTQLKEVFLPAPIVSFATGVGSGVNVEAYVQGRWNQDYLPPTGSYWSFGNGLGAGYQSYGFTQKRASDDNQYGIAVHWQPSGIRLNLGAYMMNYQDKSPELVFTNASFLTPEWLYAPDRRLYGLSTNFQLGNWAIGSELSYRPRDAVSLNPNVDACAATNGVCYVDHEKFQWHLTGILSLTPGDHRWMLNALGGADTATLLAEAVVVKYPGLRKSYNGELVAAGAYGWGQETNPAGTPVPVGSATSWGYNFDFSWTYDGTVIKGWQVTPEVYYFQAVDGRTPNATALFMQGAKSANFILTLAQNPTKWQFGANFAKFWGGSSVFDQPYRDRSFVGAYLSRNI